MGRISSIMRKYETKAEPAKTSLSEHQDNINQRCEQIEDSELSPEQIENFRKVLAGIFGVYAYIMPDYEIQKFRDQLQSKINRGLK